MDVARFNLSHGGYPEHEERYRRVREAADALGRNVGVLVDLQGPKIRLGRFADDKVNLAVRSAVHDHDRGRGRHGGDLLDDLCRLTGDVSAGDRLLVDDGRILLQVEKVDGPQVVTRVIEGGPVSNNKGINLPGVASAFPPCPTRTSATCVGA